MPQIIVKNASGQLVTAARVENTGQTIRDNSLPVVLSSEDISALTQKGQMLRTSSAPVTIATEDLATLAPGSSGTIIVTTDTSPVIGNFSAIQVLDDVVFSTFNEIGASGQPMTGFPIQAGTTLFGRFTAYTLTSGKVRAYQ